MKHHAVRIWPGIFKKTGLAWFFLVLVTATAGFAQDSDLSQVETEGRWHIEADSLEYNKERDTYIARGGVVVTSQDTEIRAGEIHFDQRCQTMTASGNVTMMTGQDVLSGDHLSLNMAEETGLIHRGRVFFEARHFYITGDNIQKTGERSYQAERVSVTSCDPDNPDWHITGRDLQITVEGYGSLNRAAFWAKNIPMAYTPYLFFPVKVKRQTGFLVPEMGYSDRKWESVELPFFWAINDSSDMTLTAHHMGRRGEKLGLEYRRVFDSESKMAVMYDFFEDRKTNDEPGDDFGFSGDNLLRPNQDRYWLRMKQDHDLGRAGTAKIDLDVVSDQDYLREFKDGHTGFDKVDDYFESHFGRDLDDYNSQTRTNQASFHKGWGLSSFNASLKWFDNVAKRRWSDRDDTLQRLPELQFDVLKQQLGSWPLYYNLDSEYLYGYRQDGTRGHRVDLYPRIFMPLRIGQLFSLEPSLGFRETAWRIDTYDGTNPGAARSRSRSVYDTRLELASELYRVFPLGETSRLKHTILPEVVHEYVPRVDQEGYPVFDDRLDVIQEKNVVTYGLTNTFTLKSSAGRQASSEATPVYNYRRIGLFKIEQSYDINEAREDDSALWVNPEERQPFSPLRMELIVRPASELWLDADAAWDIYDEVWASGNAKLSWQEQRAEDDRSNRLGLEYRYRRDRSESIVLDTNVRLTSALSAYFNHERNLRDHIDIETGFGILYKAGCWSLDLGYVDKDDDRRYTFMISLLGLGGFGSEIAGSDLENPS